MMPRCCSSKIRTQFSKRFASVFAAQGLQWQDVLFQLQRLHPLWIRERCTEGTSVEQSTKQPLGRFCEFQKDLKVDEFILIDEDQNLVEVNFNDGHKSTFDISHILRMQSNHPGSGTGVQVESFEVPSPISWSHRHLWNFETLKQDERRQFHFSEELLTYGMVCIDGIPEPKEEKSAILGLAGVFGPVRKTGWGEVFNVKAQPDGNKKDLAYTGNHIYPHTDNPYRDFAPGYQWLHCIANDCSGGHNYFVDGFHVAEELKRLNPDYFRILTEVRVRFENYDGSRHRSCSTEPIISLHPHGEIKQIRYSDKSGGYAPPMDIETSNLFYQAKHAFSTLINKKENHTWRRLTAGQAVCVDNYRILHARTSFNPSEGERHYQGCYTDRDALVSLYLELQKKLYCH